MSTVGSTSNNTAASIYAALNGTSSTSSSSSSSSATSAAGLQDRFLTLLTTQLQNQDPLNPMDNSQLTSQLAQISTVSGIDKLNTTLQSLIDSSSQSQTLQAAALVGHGVLMSGSRLSLSDNLAVGGVNLDSAADKVTVTIKDGNGLTVRTMDLGAQDAGSHAFQWDGKNDSGTAVTAGEYTFSVAATQGSSTVSASALQLGVVASVVRESNGSFTLNMGSDGVIALDDVKQIL